MHSRNSQNIHVSSWNEIRRNNLKFQPQASTKLRNFRSFLPKLSAHLCPLSLFFVHRSQRKSRISPPIAREHHATPTWYNHNLESNRHYFLCLSSSESNSEYHWAGKASNYIRFHGIVQQLGLKILYIPLFIIV